MLGIYWHSFKIYTVKFIETTRENQQVHYHKGETSYNSTKTLNQAEKKVSNNRRDQNKETVV